MLRRCGIAGEGFAAGLLALAGDPQRPVIIRDYALQHLASLWSAPEAAGLRPAITSALHDLVLSGPPVSSAALLALHRLGDTDAPPGTPAPAAPGVADDRIAALAADALAASVDTPTRMAAVRIVGDRLLAEQRGGLRAIAADAAEPTVLRMAAIAAVARFADPADAAFIDSIPAEEGGLLAGALSHAARTLAAPAN